MPRPFKRCAQFAVLLVLILSIQLSVTAQVEDRGKVITSNGEYATLAQALAAAQEGETVEVYGGVHPGPVRIDKRLRLVGHDWPVIDGRNEGTVVTLSAPNILVSGFVIRNSGDSLDEENSGIVGEAQDLDITGNRFEGTLFGIYLREAHGSVIRDNVIYSKPLALARRGDPIRVWSSNQVNIEGNQIASGRDVVLYYSEQLTIRGNSIQDGRYGLHFMYCDDALIEGNRLVGNSVGAFLMYSRRLHMLGNTVADNRGPSGYGIGMKDLDAAVVNENLFLNNRVGAYLDNSPAEVSGQGWFEGNVFAYNDIGIEFMPSVRNNFLTGNSFLDNQEQVAVAGGGLLKQNTWTVAGRGNYWSNYAGYDQDGDGLGDQPFKSERLFENLMDRYDSLRLFIYSPVSQAVDFAAQAFPLVKPQPKLIDEHPLMAIHLPSGLPALPQPARSLLVRSALALLSVSLFTLIFSRASLFGRLIRQFRLKRSIVSNVYPGKTADNAGKEPEIGIFGGDFLIKVSNLTMRYGKVLALRDVSFQIQAGEAVALWGPNGAGKTSALRCLLGLLPYSGEVQIGGLEVKRHGKTVRQRLGFVPQELGFHDDMEVEETLEFYARLKKADPQSSQSLLAQLNLSEHRGKRVGELSGGLKQRLALAIALLGNPHVLILDEPTSNLDLHGRDELIELLNQLKKEGKTLVFSSHRLEEVLSLADRVLVVQGGQLVAQGLPDEMASRNGWQTRLRLYVPSEDSLAALEVLRGHGFTATPNGKGIWVQTAPGQKGLPISALAEAGIPVSDFELEPYEEKG
ncbi:MAG TPA: nitrous oxide reductase family maturation protein NosD [Anaerolineales bacterium]|nr:nitrous oxide reductase family maturation protein NosD [Anaerolineales bacterium]